MPDQDQKLVLVAVLDWGLGHAGRIVPLVTELQLQGARVMLASSGRAGLLLRRECPDLPYLECPSYDIRYPARNMYWNMLRQLPRILTVIIREHLWLRRIVRKYQVNAVISDSRFGCFHPDIPSAMVSHQLRLLLRPPLLSRLVNWAYRQLLRRFHEIWVPDEPDGLSGYLSYPSPFSPTRYIGCLSRLQASNAPAEPEHHLLVLLSGPEPQRTKLESLVVKQLMLLPELKALIVQGKTDDSAQISLEGTESKMISYLSGADLQQALTSASIVLCRSGYSSLMDLARLGKRAILIPTPGQPEQEYLAERCREKGWAVVCDQENLGLVKALRNVEKTSMKMTAEASVANGRPAEVIRTFLKC